MGFGFGEYYGPPPGGLGAALLEAPAFGSGTYNGVYPVPKPPTTLGFGSGWEPTYEPPKKRAKYVCLLPACFCPDNVACFCVCYHGLTALFLGQDVEASS